jgi:IPT/TIG domain
MGDFSVSPTELLAANRQKGYVGLHVEQGVPVLDRDLNLLQDLIVAQIRELFSQFIGDGVPAGEGFGIVALDSPGADFMITAGAAGPGVCLVSGLQVTIPAPIRYLQQAGVPALTTPTDAQPNPRLDLVYLDAWVDEVDSSTDPDLGNDHDIGIQTATRLQIRWQVLVAEDGPVPAPAAGHVHYPLARLARPRGEAPITARIITDLRQRRLTVSDVVNRMALIEGVLLLPSFDKAPRPQFVPPTGVVNQAITLNGNNFNVGTIKVFFGTQEAPLVTATSATRIVVRVPAGLTPQGKPTQVKITVSNQGGSAVSEDVFVVRAAPAFADPGSQFTPRDGTPGTRVTLSGFNFDVGTPRVTFNGVPATVVGTPTATSLVVQVPAGVVPPGSTTADARITVATEQGSDTSDDIFKVALDIPAPTFAAPGQQFTPPQGRAGELVTLNGQNFNFAPVSVQFAGVPAVITATPTPTRIIVQVPDGLVPPLNPPRPVPITVSTLGGVVTSTDAFIALSFP